MWRKSRLIPTIVMTFIVFALAAAPATWAGKKSKKGGSSSVTKVIKKVDRSIQSYSPEKARELLEPVMEENDPRVDAAMGQVLALEKDYKGAVAKLSAASNKSDDPMIFVALGDAQAQAKDKEAAESTYGQAATSAQRQIGKDPTDTEARLALGIAQQRLKQYGEATTNLTLAGNEDPSNPRVPFELGMTKMLQGDNQAGFDHLSRAIELYSGYAYAYYYRALAASKIDRKDIAVNDLDRFLRLAPEAPEASKAQRLLESLRG